MEFENTVVNGFETALRGGCALFRGGEKGRGQNPARCAGESARELWHACKERSEFLSVLTVTVDITAPLYWWREFDAYKIGAIAGGAVNPQNLAETELTASAFEQNPTDPPDETAEMLSELRGDVYRLCENLRRAFRRTGDKRYWNTLVELLPSAFLQRRTVLLSYEAIQAMIGQGQNHVLREWREKFLPWALELPYAKELIFGQ